VGKKFELNIGGGELIASVGDKPFQLAGRLAVVVPDVGMAGTYNGSKYAPIFVNSNPIVEVTFPAVTWHLNDDAKLVGEALLMFDTPEARDYNGNYVIAQMPGTATGTAYVGPNIRAGFVPIGRLMFQFQY
jgi:hypothetical protein